MQPHGSTAPRRLFRWRPCRCSPRHRGSWRRGTRRRVDPAADRAALDGFAMAARATVGANSYNPLLLPLRVISPGDGIPPDCDAVIPLDLAQPQPSGVVECVEPVAPGENLPLAGSCRRCAGPLSRPNKSLTRLVIWCQPTGRGSGNRSRRQAEPATHLRDKDSRRKRGRCRRERRNDRPSA